MRCYLFRKGHIAAVEVLNGASDDAVVEQARTVFEERKTDYEGFEVWENARFIYRYPELPPRYVSGGTEPESFYHLYLLGEDGNIQGTFDFSADSDEAAYQVGELAFEACSDRAVQFEVLHGSRLVNPKPTAPTMSLNQVMANRQAHVVALEERMRDSRWAVATSERLLARLKDLKPLTVAAD